jgi:hypothetical protein
MLKIGFYGHSICSNNSPGTYLNSVSTHFNAKLVNQGTGRGSEERILFELKKSQPDIAVIFHSHPKFLFVPNFPVDVNILDFTSDTLEMIKNKYTGFDELSTTLWTDEERVKKDVDSLPRCVELYRKHLYHTDLIGTRYQGALMLIDNFCLDRVPVTIHAPILNLLPPWFKFRSGRVIEEISNLVKDKIRAHAPNGLTYEDNEKMTNMLITVIQEELDKIT